jgi:hypothetical protein
MSVDRVVAMVNEGGSRLMIRAKLTSEGEDGAARTQEAVTIDLGRNGACVVVDEPLEVGTVVGFSSKRFFFETRASVRSISRDRQTGVCVLGLEVLDAVRNPFAWGNGTAERE